MEDDKEKEDDKEEDKFKDISRKSIVDPNVQKVFVKNPRWR